MINKPNPDKMMLVHLIHYTAGRLELFAENHFFAPLNLTTTGARILTHIRQKGRVLPTQILERFGGTKSNVTQRLNLLERNGLIKRTRGKDGKDLRTVTVELTPKGEETCAQMSALTSSSSFNVDRLIPPDDQAACAVVLKRLNLAMDELEAKGRNMD